MFRIVHNGAFLKSPAMIKTLSGAVNVQSIPFNYERSLFYLTDGNHELDKGKMAQVDSTSKIGLSTEWHEFLQQKSGCGRVKNDEIYNNLVDPQPAVALCASRKVELPT